MTPPNNLQHTNQPPECQAAVIEELAEVCSNEYYMSALGSEREQDRRRAERGRRRILEGIKKFELLEQQVTCPACRAEIAWQIALQTQGVEEIETVWKF